MRIGELSKRTTLSRDTIRLYERYGLIASEPSKSASNNYREYPEGTDLTLELIGDAQAAGLTLADLRQFLDATQDLSAPDFDGEDFLEQKIKMVEATIARSKRFLSTLKQAKDALSNFSQHTSKNQTPKA